MRIIKILLCLCLLAGCSSIARRWEYRDLMKPVIEEKMKNPNLMVDGKPEPELPDEDKNEETLGGIDSNNDGIRDDVEIWINRSESDELKRKALKQLARFYQKILSDKSFHNFKAGFIDNVIFYKIVQDRAYEEWAAGTCMNEVFEIKPSIGIKKKIKSLYLNNLSRLDYANSNQLQVSRVLTSHSRDFNKSNMYFCQY